jgi:hypothetical protein
VPFPKQHSTMGWWPRDRSACLLALADENEGKLALALLLPAGPFSRLGDILQAINQNNRMTVERGPPSAVLATMACVTTNRFQQGAGPREVGGRGVSHNAGRDQRGCEQAAERRADDHRDASAAGWERGGGSRRNRRRTVQKLTQTALRLVPTARSIGRWGCKEN